MKVLLDPNMILDHLLEREPFAEDSRKVIECLQTQPFDGYIAWQSISNIHSMASMSANSAQVREVLKDLLKFLTVASVSHEDLEAAFRFPIDDFEDALQAAAALACKAECILTRELNAYQNSPVPAILPGEFLSLFGR